MRLTDLAESTVPAWRDPPAGAAASGRRTGEVHACNARTGRYCRGQAYDPFEIPVCRENHQLVGIMRRRPDPSSMGPDCQALPGKRIRSLGYRGVSGRCDRSGSPPSGNCIHASGLFRTGPGPVGDLVSTRLYRPFLNQGMRTVRMTLTTSAS